jgi:hypothetical protein
MKLCTIVVHNLQMCMKEYRCCLQFTRGDNATYTFTKRGVVNLVSATPPKRFIGILWNFTQLRLKGASPSRFRESISWIISPFKFWTATIFLHAHLQVVFYNCVKFHKTPIRDNATYTFTKRGVVNFVSATPPKRFIGILWNFTQL